jgi:hypothetical protein
LYRLVHIQFYIGLIALALSLPAAVMIIFKFTVTAALVFLISVGLCTWISLVMTTFFYLLLSKIVNGERFKDIISYAQIVMAVVVFGSYQFLPHLMDIAILKSAVLQVKWWTYIFPPAWLAAFVKICCFSDRTIPFIILGATGVIIPVSGAIVLLKYVSGGFGNILSENTSESPESQKSTKMKTRFAEALCNLFCVSENEKAGWKLTLATTKRDRKFKQTVYPNFGIMLVFAIVVLKPDLANLAGSLQGDDFRKYFFIMIMGFSVFNAILQLPYTDTPEAGWIYRALPVTSHSHLLTGSVKAMLSKFLAPIYIILTIPSLILWGFPFLFQIILSFVANVFLVQVSILFQDTFLPFTRIREMQQKGANSLMAIISMILMTFAGGLIYLTKFIPVWVNALVCILATYCIVLIFKHIRKRKFIFT